jgi:serine protease Do
MARRRLANSIVVAAAMVAVLVVPAAAEPARGHLGMSLADVSGGAGARVDRLAADSPAARAGFREGDVVLSYDGEKVRSAAQLARLVRETVPGRKVAVEVQRGGSRTTLTAEVAGREDKLSEWGREIRDELRDLPIPSREQWEGWMEELEGFTGGKARPARLGLRYQEVSGQLARFFRLERERGVLVTEVAEGSPAAKAGLRAGDVLLRAAGADILDGGDLRRALSEARTAADLPIRVWRDGKGLDLTLHLFAENEHPL